MANNIYSIELNLTGDINDRLDEAIGKARNLRRQLNGKYGTGSFGNPVGGNGGRRYPHIPENRIDTYRRWNWWLYRSRFGNNKGFFQNVDNAYQARSRFLNNFVANSFTASGWQRNLGNFANMMSSIGKTAMTAVPALKAFGGSIGFIATAAAGSALAGGLLYRWGRNSLMSENTSQAISNVSQYNMARLGQGENYAGIYNAATDITSTIGGSRAGLVSLMNTMTGLTVGDTKLTSKDAEWFGELAAKISAVSGKDLQLVGLNLQQLFTTWQGIDMKELFKAVPLIEKYVFDLRAQAVNKGDDIYSFIRENPQALIKAASMFMGQMELPRTAVLKGRLQLSEENLETEKLQYLEKFYEHVSNMGIKINKLLAELFKEFGENYDMSIFQRFVDTFESLITFTIKAATKIVEFMNKYPKLASTILGALTGAVIGTAVAPGYGTISGAVLGAGSGLLYSSMGSKYNVKEEDAIRKFNNTVLTSKYIYRSPVDNQLHRREEPLDEPVSINLDGKDIKRVFQGLNDLATPEADELIKRLRYYNPDMQDLAKALELITKMERQTPDINNVSADSGRMKDLSKGSKSLIINFNKSIVDMDNHISTSDPDMIGKIIEEYVINAIPRAMHIALNQATPLT